MNTENVANVGGAVAEQKSWGDVAMGVVNYGAGVLREAAARQQRRQDVLTLQHVWMYDEEEASRKAVDGSAKYAVYAEPRARHDESSLALYGRDYAAAAMPGCKDDPWRCVEEQLKLVRGEEDRKRYREEFAKLRLKGGDTADDYYRLVGRMVRDEVRGVYEAKKAEWRRKVALVDKMDRFAMGEDVLSDDELADVRSVLEPEAMESAEAVREFMKVYVLPLEGQEDAEAVLRGISRLEDELFEVIGEDEGRAQLAYQAMMGFAQRLKDSNKMGVGDEFVVAVGKSLQNWGNMVEHSSMKAAAESSPERSWAYGVGWFSEELAAKIRAEERAMREKAKKDLAEYEARLASRAILREAINRSVELSRTEGLLAGSVRAASQMAGQTLPYFIPYVGMYAGTADVLVRGGTEAVEAHRFYGMGEADARGRAALDAVVQGAVELMPWSRVGGKGFSAFTRKWMGKGMAKGTSGGLSRWVVRQTQSGVGRALMAEAAVGFVDEAVLEPLVAGLLTYGGEWLMDKVLGVPHGPGREFGKCFEELGAIWSDPRQVAGMALFSAGLAGSGYWAARKNVQYFAQFRNVWLATGLKQGQVDELMAIADVEERAKRGAAMVNEGWENDPAGMEKRVLKANRRLKERGEVLFMTGEGALAEEKRVPELQDAYRTVWNEYVERGVLPRVEARGENEFAIIEKGKPERVLDAAAADAYLQHAVDVAESVMMGEARTAVERAQGVNLRDEVADAVSRIAGNAAVRAVEAGSERTGIEVVDLVQGLPEEIAGPIVARGQVTLEDAAAISEYALGQIRALVEGGMSEQEARMTPAEAAGVARSLGEMATFAASFAKREAKAQLAPGEKGAITIGRRRGVREVEFDGARVMGQVLMTLPGRVRHYGAVEDVTESVTDMMVQQRAQVIAEEAKGEVSLAAAEEQAWDELAEVVSRARAAVLKADKTAHIEEVKKGDKMGIIEALSTMAQAKFLTSKVVPRWMQGLTDALKGILGAGVAVEKVRAAYAAVLRKKPEALADIEKVLDRLGVHVGAVLREARVEAVDVQAWKSASAVAGVRAAGPLGVGGAAVSDVVQEAERVEEEIVRAEGQQEVLPVKSAAEVAAEAKRELDARVPGSNAPEHMRGVFEEDKCYYYEPGGFWCGMIAKEKLSDGTEQVKVGVKGKHGVIQGKELTGNFRHDTAAIYIWKRKDGSLQVISGRHRFAKLMEDDSATSCNCYVFEETDERDEKWARMLDYELNMCDNQADEVTAATYVRETGLSDGELHRRGLMRGKSRCKRGVLIGRHAGQELWTRFTNGAIKPKDAEVVVELTRSLKDKSRVDEIQGKCCMLLAKKKSWEYIAGMVQLMARAEAQMTQGLLDFGADFMADLERAAEWIEKSVQKINAALTVLKDGQSMAKGRKKDDAARLGVHTETEADAEEMIRDLEMLKKQFEFIGSYPALLQQAELWDGKSEVDPIGYYLENARRERIEAAVEGEMSADEYLEAQARKMAEEAVPELFSMSMDGAQDVVASVSFNVIGQKAETWGEYEGKAFAGRDDGMLRAEIDASQAKLKLQGISGKVLQELGDKVLAGMAGFEAAVGEEERADLVRYAELKKKGARHLTNAEIEEYRGLLRTGMGLEAQLFEALDGQVERDRVVELLTAPDRGRAVELYLQGRSKGDVEGLVYALEDVLEYPELYRAYPQLRGMRVELVQGMGRYHGVYSEKFGGIKLNAARSEEMLLSTLLHEVQHAIQYIEGFAKGGGESKAAELAGQDARYAGLRGFDLYQRMAGEIEARAVQARMGLDGAGRLARPFNEALEYPGEALVSYEMERIREAALADSTFMKAPNGKDSNLNERQWLQVRTRAFKRWFGDWKRAAELTFVSTGYDYKKGRVELDSKDSVLFNESLNLRVELNRAQKDKAFSPNARRKSIDNGFTSEQHCAVAAHLPNAFKHAILLGEYNDAEADVNIAKIMRLGAPVIVDGQKALAFLTVKVSYQKKKEMEKPAENVEVPRLYSLELDEIVRLGGQLKRLEHLQQNASSPSSEEIINDFNAKVKEYFDNVSKIVDENGEPLVVYHGSPHYGFTVFDKSRRGERDRGDFGRGFYFTPNKGYASTYAKEGYWNADGDESKVYACFLNIREPMQVRARQAENIERWKFDEAEGVMVYTDRYYELAWNSVKNLSEIVVHDSVQIKSATDNRGTFDGGNGDITFSLTSADIDRKTLPGGLPLYTGYRVNELGHGEYADLEQLADFLEGDAVATVADKKVKLPKSWNEIVTVAKDVATHYDVEELLVPFVGNVVVNAKGVKDSMNHFMKNKHTTIEHKQRACDALLLVPEVLTKGLLVEYGQETNKLLDSYLIAAPIKVGNNQCVMIVRVRKAVAQHGRFYLHGIDLLENVKEEAREFGHHWGSGLNTGKPYRADSRDVFRVARKAFAVKYNYAYHAAIRENNEPTENFVSFALRSKGEPKKKGIGYKVFYQKDGKLYPPMVANPGGEDTPVGVWLDADEGVRAGESKTGRPQVKAGGKGTQGGSGTLAYRPGWHLGKIPYALQFNRKNPVTGERDLFPKDFVWAEVEYAADVDYQEEAMSYGLNKNGKFQHSLAGLPRIPEDGYYEYRTNPNPATDPWIITGAMKVKRVLTRAEVDELVRAAGREPQKVEEALVTFSMESVAAEWQNTLDGYLQNPAKPGTPEHTRDLVVCPTPAVMQMVGAKGWDMVVTPGVLDKVMRGKHAVSVEALRQLPAALAAPVCIAVSDTPGCLEVVTELKEGQHNVLVAVQLNSEHASLYKVKVNRIASMYGKERIASLLNHPMLYWDKAKARPWVNNYRLQLPAPIQPRRASGRRIQTPADLVKYKMQSGLSFAMERASLQALDVLRTRADEREGERLMNDWQRACEGWAQLHVGGDDTRLGNGAKMLGEIHALIGATKGVLPEKYARMGHLNGLLRWAAVYAQMQQTGEVPESGVIAGPIYEKFVERMRYVDRKNAAFGLNEAEVKEAMAMLAGERLDVAMLKVATECKRRLELFLKDRERERIDWVVERAYPKREKGKRTPRGKMDADTYRRMERAYELMGMEAGAKAGLVERLKGVLEKLDSAPAEAVEVLRGMRHVVDVPEVDDVEALEELLEDELYLAETFGAWEAMAYEQARTASGAMAEMVLLGRNAWQQKLREERRRAAYDREEIARHFRVKLEDVLAERGDKGAKERARKRTIAKKIAMQTMSYSQLMLALEPMLGKRFVGRQMRMIAAAHERLQVGAQQRHEWMFKTLAQITGLKTEGEIEEWMVANNTVFDTGIDLEMPMKTKCRLTPEEAREWLRLTAEERAEKRQKMTEEAHAKGEKPDNVPGEDVLDELEGRLMEAEQSGLMPKEFVLETVWSYKTRLKCAKEALLFAILTFEQEDYAHLMEVNGLTDAKVQQMRELVGPQLLRWGYAMRKELSVHGKEMAEVYEAHTGVPFGMRNNYFTGVFDVARAKDKGEAVDQPAGVGGGKYGRLISRQHHNQQLNWQTSATAVFVGTMREQLNYVATSHISRSWQTLLADRLFERRLRAEIGDAALDLIQNWCQMIDGAVLADAKVNALMHRFLGRVMAAYAVSRLAGNVYTFMKQGSALLNGFVGGYVPEHVMAGNELVQHLTYRHIGFGEYVAALAKAVSGKTEITAQELAKAGFIAGRKRVTGSHVEEAALLAPGQKVPGKLGRKMRALYEANMDAIGWADVAANTRAALAVAEVVYQQAKRENKDGLVPDAELRRVAIETAGLMIDRAAQPQLRTQKGYWAAGGGMFGALGNFFFMFKSEVLAKVGLYTAQMMAGKHGAWIVGALSFGVANSLVLALIDWIGGRWYDDDEDKWKKRLAKFSFNVVANDISSVPGVGDAVGDLRSAVLGEWSFGSSRLVDLVPFGEMGKYGAREVKNIAEGARLDKHVGALCGLARSVGAAGGWFQGGRSQTVNSCAELALAAANVSNWGRFFKDVGKKVEGKKDKPKKKRRKKKD